MSHSRLDSPWATAAFGLIVALFSWHYVQITPVPGLDGSWILALNLSAAAGADHGTDFIFTYGPLGFLEQPMVVDGLLAMLGAIYLLAIRAAFAASLLWAARRSFAWPIAAALALVVATIAPSAIVPQALAAVWCLVALGDEAPGWTRRLLLIGGPLLAALELLVKINVGLTVAAIVAIAVVALPGPRLRQGAIALGVFIGGIAVLWLVAGQGLTNFDDYLRSSREVVAGYSENSQAEAGVVGWDWAAALLVGLASVAAAIVAGARLRTAQRIAIVAIVAVLALALEKYAFVRHDAGHIGAFFGCLAVVWLALVWRDRGRWVAAGAVAMIAIFYFATTGERPADSLSLDRGADQLRTLLVPGERHDAADSARAAMAAAYAVDPRILERIGDQPVDARPWEVGLVWAYGLNWDPLPVIQDYAAYTPELDRTNAEALAAADGPRFILRHYGFGSPSVGAEGRYINFDSPQEARELFCRFGAVVTSGQYQLLERTGADRCGPERPLETVEADYGEPVTVPRAGPRDAVFARIDGVDPAGIERLRTLLYRSSIRRFGLGPARARFAASNASGGLLISAPRALDYPRPFNLAPDVRSISVDSERGFATTTPTLGYEFFAVPVNIGAEPK